MVRQILQARLRLAGAMLIYFRVRHPQLNFDIAGIIAAMHPRVLNWPANTQDFDDTDMVNSTTAQLADHNPFSNWSPAETKFYHVVDFHVAAANILIDNAELDLDLDLEEFFNAVSVMFYSHVHAMETDKPGKAVMEAIKHDIMGFSPGDIATLSSAITEPMDPTAAAAAREYKFMQLTYLQLPKVDDILDQSPDAVTGVDFAFEEKVDGKRGLMDDITVNDNATNDEEHKGEGYAVE